MKTFLMLLFASLFLFSACKKDEAPNSSKNIVKTIVSGVVQKGPFLSGSNITIYELDNQLVQTGKSFTTQIVDNDGSFEIANIELVSPYIEVVATGFYFNENTGKNSIAPISLYSICDISLIDNFNINVLSHLERERLRYLVQKGTTFNQAKETAKRDVLSIFGLSEIGSSNFEDLDISKTGTDNAKLLALSVIIQGFRSESQMIELLAAISNDLKADGELSDSTKRDDLYPDAKLLKLNSVKTNIIERYTELGKTVNLSDFTVYVDSFVNLSGVTM